MIAIALYQSSLNYLLSGLIDETTLDVIGL